MRKVGIFTLTHSLNYGAFYQMFALYSYLNSQEDLEVVLYRQRESVKTYLLHNFAFSLKRIKRKRFFADVFAPEKYNVRCENYNGEHLDFAIFGSDEIWNIRNVSFFHDARFFGRGVSSSCKIAYAPSIGFSKYNDTGFLDYKADIGSLEAVFYRDINTNRMLKLLGKENGVRVCDPTILYGDWANSYSRNVKEVAGMRYVVYYSYISDPDYKEALIAYAKENDLRIVSSGYIIHDWVDYNLELNPWDFLGLLQGAELVCTTTFHGSIMTLFSTSPLLISNASPKVHDLLEFLDINQCHYNPEMPISTYLHSRDSAATFSKLKEFGLESRSLISKYIK